MDWLIDLLAIVEEEDGREWDDEREDDEDVFAYEGQERRAMAQFDKFLRKSMVAFLEEKNEECEELEMALLDQFQKDNERVEGYLMELDAECERMAKEIEFLKGEANG